MGTYQYKEIETGGYQITQPDGSHLVNIMNKDDAIRVTNKLNEERQK